MLPAVLRTLAQPWVAELFFGLFAGLCLLAAAYEVRNVSRSRAAGRYLALAILSAILAVVFHFLPPRRP